MNSILSSRLAAEFTNQDQSANTDEKVRLIKAKGIVTAFLLRKQTVILNCYQHDFIHDGNSQLLILNIELHYSFINIEFTVYCGLN